MSRLRQKYLSCRQYQDLLWISFSFVVLGSISTPHAIAQEPVENVILLKFTEHAFESVNFQVVNGIVQTNIQSLDNLGQQFGLAKAQQIFRHSPKNKARHEQFGLPRFYKFIFQDNADIETAATLYQANPNIEFAQRSRKYVLYSREKKIKRIAFTPNDPLLSNQWHYHNTGQTGGTPDADIDAPEAWNIETGNPSVIVSDLDTGQDINHPDLAANIWVNLGEIPGNGIDDDGNGYIDDVNGWDFSDNDNNPADYDNHGTHTAGTVAAVTNNGIGVAGVAFNAKVMPCKVFPNATDDVISEAFIYAADNGSIVSTNSWGYSFPGPPSPVMEAAIDYFSGATNGVIVFAAGNSNSSDPSWGYPASYPPVIAVAATDHNDTKASFSNYGSWVDVSAPGVNVWSTVIGGYASFQGTSMACPHVAGIAALLFSNDPGMTGADVRAQIETSTDFIDTINQGFEGLLGTGRVNAFQALTGGPFPNPPANLQATVNGDFVDLAWEDPTQNTDGTPINPDHISVYRDGAEIVQVGPDVQVYTDPDVSLGQHSYFVTATNVEGFESHASNTANVLIGNFDILVWQHPQVTQVNVAKKAAERGLTIADVESMVHEPQSSQAILDALIAIGKNPILVSDIVGLDLAQFDAVFAVLGTFPNNHVIQANSPEALALEDYIANGRSVYMEGGDLWYYDPQFVGGHDFNALFGLNPLSDGTGDLSTVLGVTGTFTGGLDFQYTGANNFIDQLQPVTPNGFTIHQNSSPSYDCGIASDAGTYKTIGTSFEFGGLADGAATKEKMMAEYADFLGVPGASANAVLWIPDDVLVPNLVEKASQRGLTLSQVEKLKVDIQSHLELEAALIANGKTVQITNNLTSGDLANAQYLFVVLGIYPNNHVIKNNDPEAQTILEFMAAGGKVYMEGGDVWYYDPENLNGFNFAPEFGIIAEEDGRNDLKTVLGACFVDSLDFVYKGVNNFIDHIVPEPLSGACQFHQNFAPDYGVSVGYDPGTGTRMIGLSFQFGGLDDNSLSTATKDDLMAKYLDFLDTGISVCQITVLSPNGGETITGGSTYEIQWTSVLTSGFVDLELSTDGGSTFGIIAAGETDDGSYEWSVPDINSTTCLIRISDTNDPNCFDESDTEFSIGAAPWIAPISVNQVTTISTASIGLQNFDLAFGGHPAATDGFDPGLDVVAAPPGFNYYAYFAISALPNFLNTDIRGWVAPFDTDIDWTLQVVNAIGITSEVSWEPDSLPPQGSFRLKESNLGIDVDMRQQSSVQLTGNATLTIEYRSEVCVSYEFTVAGGAWYLISLPVVPQDNSAGALFPGNAAAFGWDFASNNYMPADSLDPGRAYWLLMLQTDTVQVCGQPFNNYTTTYNDQGWDMIGAVADTSEVVDDPDGSVISMFGWDPLAQNYVQINSFMAEPQQGYWILVFTVPSTVTVGSSSGSSAGLVARAGRDVQADLAAFYRLYGTLPPPPPSSALSAQHSEISLPTEFSLSQNYPNPFNPETVIEYRLPEAHTVTLKVYTILGQEIRTLVDAVKPEGNHRVQWDGRNSAGQQVAPGIYLYRLDAGDFSQTRKLVLVK